jgi:hypothetical protein
MGDKTKWSTLRIQIGRKSRIIPDTCSLRQRSHRNYKPKKNDVTLSVLNVRNVTKFEGYRLNYRHLIQKVERKYFCPARFLRHGNGLSWGYYRFVWPSKIGKCIPKFILASYLRTRCQVVFDNEHSLRLIKRLACTSTAEGK